MNTRNKILVVILVYLIILNIANNKEHFWVQYPVSTRNMSYDLRGDIKNTQIGPFFYGLFPFWWISPHHPYANYRAWY